MTPHPLADLGGSAGRSVAARQRIAGRVHQTPVQSSATLSRLTGTTLWLKCENLQKTGSFKPRGALNKVLQLSDAEKQRGVVTVSAGNHAQALAWATQAAGVPCTVVMPAAASPAKVDASRGYGAQVILHGVSAEAFQKAHDLAKERDLVFVHPFDDEQIIAGAGTVGLEIAEQVPEATVIVTGLGGGGLISGVSAVIKGRLPKARVYGVEPEGANAMRQSLDAGHPVRLAKVQTIADGLAPPMAGDITYQYVRQLVDDVVVVTDDEIRHAMRLIIERTKLLVEPSGAAAVAALLAKKIPVRANDVTVAVLGGGNVGVE
ncbi:MAG TPA: threonine/serine dehydratase, partial [Gemmatimonadales bacterium]